MGREAERKCLNCGKSFKPDARNVRHQQYCSATLCQGASKRASQARWLAKPENRGYFMGAQAVARVQVPSSSETERVQMVFMLARASD